MHLLKLPLRDIYTLRRLPSEKASGPDSIPYSSFIALLVARQISFPYGLVCVCILTNVLQNKILINNAAQRRMLI